MCVCVCVSFSRVCLVITVKCREKMIRRAAVDRREMRQETVLHHEIEHMLQM